MESATCCGMELIAKQSYGIKPQKNAPLVMPYAYGDMMHLLRKYDVAPLRFAMMRCLPQNVAKPRIIRRSRHHWRSQHHLPKANIIQKSLICLPDKLGFFVGAPGRIQEPWSTVIYVQEGGSLLSSTLCFALRQSIGSKHLRTVTKKEHPRVFLFCCEETRKRCARLGKNAKKVHK